MKNIFTITLLSIPFLLAAQIINDEIRYEVLVLEMTSSAGGDTSGDNEYTMIYSVTSDYYGITQTQNYCFGFDAEGDGYFGNPNSIGIFHDVPYDDFFTVELNAWEDDEGNRCSFDESDDNFYYGFAPIYNNCISCQPGSTWIQGIGSNGATNWMGSYLQPLVVDWDFHLAAIWRYEVGDDLHRTLDFGEIANAGQKTHTNNNKTVSDDNPFYAYQYQNYRSEPSPEVYYAFEINGAATSELVITTEFPETDFDTKIYLLDDDNNEIAVNDDIVPGNTASRITTQLCAGRYKVIVEGYDNDKGTFKIGITATSVPDFSGTFSVSTNLCPGQTNGFISVNLTGGLPPYLIEWPTGAASTDTIITGLGAGEYIILVADNCNISGAANITITDIDITDPIAICADTTYAFVEPGEILNLNPIDFDGGSFDNCSAGADLEFYMFPSQVSASDPAVVSYELQVTDESGYTGICHGFIRVEVLTAVSQDAELEKAFRVYPNPTNGLTTVQIKGIDVEDGFLTLRDMKGMLLKEQRINTSTNWSKEFDISDSPAGIYTLQIIADGRQLTKKVVKY